MSLRYRYPGTNWIEVDADEYIIHPGNVNPITFTYDAWVDFKCLIYDPSIRAYTGNPDAIRSMSIFGTPITIDGEVFYPHAGGKQTYFKLCVTSTNFLDNSRYRYCPIDTGVTGRYFDLNTLQIVGYRQDTYVLNRCFFSASKDGTRIFSKTSDVCPEVELINQQEQCPPGTCQVDCGSVYCCYGSDGIAVSSIAK